MKINKLIVFTLLMIILLSGVLPTNNNVYAAVTKEQIMGQLSQIYMNPDGSSFQSMLSSELVTGEVPVSLASDVLGQKRNENWRSVLSFRGRSNI